MKKREINATVSVFPKPFEPSVSISLGTNPVGGTGNYDDLMNKPSINGVELEGDLTADELDLQEEMEFLTDQEIDDIIFGPSGVPFVPTRMGVDLRDLVITDIQ